METKLYVGNLSFDTSENELRTLFNEAGTVTSINLITDQYSGRSRGFAFVEMSTQSEAEEAIKKFNGYSFANRELKVNIARPREERPRNDFSRRREQGGRRDRNQRGGKRDRRY